MIHTANAVSALPFLPGIGEPDGRTQSPVMRGA